MCAVEQGVPFPRTGHAAAESRQGHVSRSSPSSQRLTRPSSLTLSLDAIILVHPCTPELTYLRSRAAQLEKLEGKIEHLVNALSKSQAQKAFSGVDYGQPSPPVSSTSERSDRSQSQTQRASREELLNAMCM